jgi:predicted transcriptional regulator
MALTKQKIQDKLEVVSEHKHIQIRYANQILEDGNVISSSYERTVVSCGDWEKAEEHNITALAQALWTEEMIDSYKALTQQVEPTPNEEITE